MTFLGQNRRCCIGSIRGHIGPTVAYFVIGFCLLNASVTAQQNSDLSKVDLSGDWAGTITHANDGYSYVYDYTLMLKQNGKIISGTSSAEAITVHNEKVAVVFEVKGQSDDLRARIKDSKVILSKKSDKDPFGWWC